ncbi:spectrin beta chain brain 1 [Clonorchis sinensis]|uniref:Spectrin beta chain brain 1 n=1 Tax=Clonorchis sinensis TaxID=79923 RepID=G7YVW6_CLOSI|nr:spectrin beta chain brain 1 [Clonorchis sinensis]
MTDTNVDISWDDLSLPVSTLYLTVMHPNSKNACALWMRAFTSRSRQRFGYISDSTPCIIHWHRQSLDEREYMQKVLFTKWINAQLGVSSALDSMDSCSPIMDIQRAHPNHMARLWGLQEFLCVRELFTDLRDGRVLIRLLEQLSGQYLIIDNKVLVGEQDGNTKQEDRGSSRKDERAVVFTLIFQSKPNTGQMRIHQLENVNKALRFLYSQGAHLENLGAQDIVDGNPNLTLGLIWTIILHFQVQPVVVQESDETGEARHAKDALLLWCQLKTAAYPEVDIVDFTSSWRDGLAFCALLHRHHPEMIDFNQMLTLDKEPEKRLEIVFNQADDYLGIPKLIEPSDFAGGWWADERCTLTVVVTWYKWLNDSQSAWRSANRLNHVLNQCVCSDRMISRYLVRAHRWLRWARSATNRLDGIREMVGNHETRDVYGMTGAEISIRVELQKMTDWRQGEKADKIEERGQIEFLLHKIQVGQLAAAQVIFHPPVGYQLSDIEAGSNELSASEHNCHLAIITQLLRQAYLYHLRQRFDRKVEIFLSWLDENQHLISVAEQTDLVHFRTDAKPIESFFQSTFADFVQTDVELHRFPVQSFQITTVCRKHAAWIIDMDVYADIHIQKLKLMIKELEFGWHSNENQERRLRWENLGERWSSLRERTKCRADALNCMEKWYQLLVEFQEMLKQVFFRVKQINQYGAEQGTKVEVALENCEQDLLCSLKWGNSAHTLIQLTEAEDFKIIGSPIMEELRDSVKRVVNWTEGMHCCLTSSVSRLRQWNAKRLQALQIKEDIEAYLYWIKDRECRCQLPSFEDIDPTNYNDIVLCAQHLRSQQRILENELILRYAAKSDGAYSGSNQTFRDGIEDLHLVSCSSSPSLTDLSVCSIQSTEIIVDQLRQQEQKAICSGEPLSMESLIEKYERQVDALKNNFGLDSDTMMDPPIEGSMMDKRSGECEPECVFRLHLASAAQLLGELYWNLAVVSKRVSELWVKAKVYHEQLDLLEQLCEQNAAIDDMGRCLDQTYQNLDLDLVCIQFDRMAKGLDEKITSDSTDALDQHPMRISLDHEITFNSQMRKLDHAIEKFMEFPDLAKSVREKLLQYLASKSTVTQMDIEMDKLTWTRSGSQTFVEESLKDISSIHEVASEPKSPNESDSDLEEEEEHAKNSEDLIEPLGESPGTPKEKVTKTVGDVVEETDPLPQITVADEEHVSLEHTCKENTMDVVLDTKEQEDQLNSISCSVTSITEEQTGLGDFEREEVCPRPVPSPSDIDLKLVLHPSLQLVSKALLTYVDLVQSKAQRYLECCIVEKERFSLKRDALLLREKIAQLGDWTDTMYDNLSSLLPELAPRAHGKLPFPTRQTEEDGEDMFVVEEDRTLVAKIYRFSLLLREIQASIKVVSEITKLDKRIYQAMSDMKGNNGYEELANFIVTTMGGIVLSEEEGPADFDLESERVVESDRLSDVEEKSTEKGIIHFKITEDIQERWNKLQRLKESRQTRFDTAKAINTFYRKIEQLNNQIAEKYIILLSTDELGTDLNSLIQLQRKLFAWEEDMEHLSLGVEELRNQVEDLQSRLRNEAPGRRDLRLISSEWLAAEEVERVFMDFETNWDELQAALNERQEKLLISAELQHFLQASQIY